jgi:glycosyltransferase involved in cell wall biosynthesis
MGGDEEGGLENHVIEICNALAKQHEIHIIAHEKYTSRFEGVHVHPVDLTKSRRNLSLLFLVRQLIHRISPDIVHAQANKAVSIIASLRVFLPNRIKYVATLHSLKRNLSSYEKFDWVIGVSGKVLEKLKTEKKSVIYNGVFLQTDRIRTREYLLKELDIPENNKVFVSMGRLVEVKRFDLLIDAFKGIQDAHLLIVGEGEEEQTLESQINELHLENIHMLGHRTDNLEILSAADVCVISSEREGFSYVMAESLLVKTPVISTDVADMKIILPRQVVVSVNNSEGLGHLIRQVNQEYEEYLKLYDPTFKWASKKLTFEKMVNSTNLVYRDLHR